MTTKAEKLAAILAETCMTPDVGEAHLEILARHGLDVERSREIDRRVMKELAEEGYPAPDEDEDDNIS